MVGPSLPTISNFITHIVRLDVIMWQLIDFLLQHTFTFFSFSHCSSLSQPVFLTLARALALSNLPQRIDPRWRHCLYLFGHSSFISSGQIPNNRFRSISFLKKLLSVYHNDFKQMSQLACPFLIFQHFSNIFVLSDYNRLFFKRIKMEIIFKNNGR